MNVADSYTGVRYGDSTFRDLNAVAEGYSTKGARDFFRDMLLRNAKHYKTVLDEQKLRDQFAKFDKMYEGKG